MTPEITMMMISACNLKVGRNMDTRLDSRTDREAVASLVAEPYPAHQDLSVPKILPIERVL
jgi:hypothetical protein